MPVPEQQIIAIPIPSAVGIRRAIGPKALKRTQNCLSLGHGPIQSTRYWTGPLFAPTRVPSQQLEVDGMDPWLTMFLYGQGGFHFHVRYSESQPLKHRFSFGFISSQVAPHTRPGGALRHGVAGDGEGLRPAASELPRALREPLRRHGALFSSPRLSTRGRPSATEGTHGRQVHHAPKDLAVDHRVAGWTFVLLGGWRRRNCLRVIWRLGCWRGHKGLERMGFSPAVFYKNVQQL